MYVRMLPVCILLFFFFLLDNGKSNVLPSHSTHNVRDDMSVVAGGLLSLSPNDDDDDDTDDHTGHIQHTHSHKNICMRIALIRSYKTNHVLAAG